MGVAGDIVRVWAENVHCNCPQRQEQCLVRKLYLQTVSVTRHNLHITARYIFKTLEII